MTLDVQSGIEAGSERTLGGIAIGSAVAVAVILGVHPVGTTDLYGDGVEFVEHVGPYWITIHLAAAFVILAFPLAIAAWGASLSTVPGRVWGRLAASVATVGTAIGVIHLVATDTILIAFFQDTVEAAGEDGVVSADLVMRLHAGTLTAWIIGFWLGVQAVCAIAAWVDGRRSWELYLPAAAVLLLIISLSITVAEGQYTTVSEMLFFRVPVVLFLIWLILVGRQLRERAAETVPASAG